MRTLRYPLTLNGAGRTSTTVDPAQTVRDQIAVLLTTAPGERPEDLNYGSEVSALLFQGAEYVEDTIGETVTNALQTYLQTVSIDNVEIENVEQDSGRVSIAVSFIASGVEETAITLIEG